MNGPVLCIETSGYLSSVALFNKGNCLINLNSDTQNSHSELLHNLISACLNDQNLKVSDLRGLVMGGGPGSNTGLRIGLATLKGLAFSNKISIQILDTHAAMAASAPNNPCLVITSSKPGLFNFSLLNSNQIVERGVTKNLNDLHQFHTKFSETLIFSPNQEIARFFPESKTELKSPEAIYLGNYLSGGKNILRINQENLL